MSGSALLLTVASARRPSNTYARAQSEAEAPAKEASSLDIPVLAEGVESADVAALLHEIGCAHGQGFYFGWPMSAKHVGALLRYARDLPSGSKRVEPTPLGSSPRPAPLPRPMRSVDLVDCRP